MSPVPAARRLATQPRRRRQGQGPALYLGMPCAWPTTQNAGGAGRLTSPVWVHSAGSHKPGPRKSCPLGPEPQSLLDGSAWRPDPQVRAHAGFFHFLTLVSIIWVHLLCRLSIKLAEAFRDALRRQSWLPKPYLLPSANSNGHLPRLSTALLPPQPSGP